MDFLDPVKSFLHLNEISEAPFAAFFKKDVQFALCSSPERFLVKRGTKLISQPIKGTAPRHMDHKLDTKLASMLAQDAKERCPLEPLMSSLPRKHCMQYVN